MSMNKIINGPYLLAPTTSQITIAWEMIQPHDLKLTYNNNTTANDVICGDISYKREPACREYENGCYLYTCVLNNLQAGSCYTYRIYDNEQLLSQGEFRTFQEKPAKIRLITVSDSHLFHTEKQFSAMIDKTSPDLILHSGDISFGTGYQREQYEQNWFQKIPEVLKKVPVYYVPGNHDDGNFYETFFATPQAETVNTFDNGYTYSFDYGNTHFVMVNSNPWGLFEMNAVNSGLKADNKTKKYISDILKWVEADLNTPKAKKAKWRIMVLHHPYTDEFNNKYIVPIAERNKVNLVIGGHLHYYTKTVSINPDVGAETIYISQGSLQDGEADISKIEERRLFGDFPEVMAIGHNNYGLLEIDDNELCYNLYGFTENSSELVDTIKINHNSSKLKIEDIEITRLDNIGNVEISAQIQNLSSNLTAAKLSLFDNKKEHIINLFGNKKNSHVILLEANEQRKVHLFYQAIEPGRHEIRVEDVVQDILVFEPNQLSFEHMKLFVSDEDKGDCLNASIEATNNLDREIFTSVPLYINQHIAESKNVFFRAHEKKSLYFNYKFEQSGSYQISIADQLPKQIQIEGGIRIIPRIHDKSGNGHYALLHGTPKVISSPDKVEVSLEAYGDYIEIPPSKDFIVKNAFCGMVWAKIERLAHKSEMGHNPLMVKGKSVGWGATYLMRMVVERAGGLKWGTCHDITEYSWQGGQADIGNWTHYTMSFDKKLGGNSYCNDKCVAHIAGIDDNCQLRQWENEPIFVGYSYIGHIIPEINRPKYFTHLPAKISQVRFYTDNITSVENAFIDNHPEQPGPKDKDLAVWLDFRDILTIGTHVTQWRHPAIYNPEFKTAKKYWQFRQLKIRAVIPMRATIKTTVEVSDDGSTVKSAKKITVKDGTNYIDLSCLPKAQYIRLTTEMTADVGSDGTFVPELKEYQISAFNGLNFTDINWSTRSEWEKGIFTGAVGFAPVGRLREYPEYTDIIHG